MFGKNKGKVVTPKGTSGYNYETVLINGEKTTEDIYDEINEQIGKRPGVRLVSVTPLARLQNSEFAGNTSSIIMIFEREA